MFDDLKFFFKNSGNQKEKNILDNNQLINEEKKKNEAYCSFTRNSNSNPKKIFILTNAKKFQKIKKTNTNENLNCKKTKKTHHKVSGCSNITNEELRNVNEIFSDVRYKRNIMNNHNANNLLWHINNKDKKENSVFFQNFNNILLLKNGILGK